MKLKVGGQERERAREGKKLVAIRRALPLFCFSAFVISVFVSPALPLSPLPALSLARSTAHKFHLSFTQIEFNAREKTAEITIRVFADDLENALSQHSGKAIKLDQKETPALIAAYLRETLDLKGRNGQSKKLTWIGMEPKADVALLYVEARMPEGIAGAQLRHRVFFELFEDQINQVLVKSTNAKFSVEFKRGDGFKVLS